MKRTQRLLHIDELDGLRGIAAKQPSALRIDVIRIVAMLVPINRPSAAQT